jgi:uncharacterized protein YozE (UPF0346 family)
MKQVKGLFTLPPQDVEIKINDQTPFFQQTEANITYTIEWGNKIIPLDKENIIHLNDNKVDTNDENYLKGTSKIENLKAPLNNIRAAYDARGTNLRNLGALGIISSAARDGTGSIPLIQSEKEDVQNELRNYGVLKSQWRYIVSSKALDYTQISTDLDKLETFEEVAADFDKICDSFGLTRFIFSTAEGTTFTNKKEAEKQAYQDTIIPESREWTDALNKYFETENESWQIVGRFDHLPVLQEDKNENANTLNTLTNALSTQLADGVITTDEYKEQINQLYGD